MALDLRDELGQLFSALKIGLQSLAEHLGPKNAGEIANLIHLSQKIIDPIRALAYHLRPAILDNFGLVAAVEDLYESMAAAGMIEVAQKLEEVKNKALSPEVKTALFRFVQESLTNVVHHAGSSRAPGPGGTGLCRRPSDHARARLGQGLQRRAGPGRGGR